MGQSSFDLTAAGATGPLSIPYASPMVCLYAGGQATWLPNVRCTHVAERVGPDPPTAGFRYIQDDNLQASFGWPSRVDQVFPLDASGPYVVRPDDRLVVFQPNPDGSPLFLFDGFAQIPQADLTAQSEVATFTAVGVAIREFDSPIVGRTQRHADPAGIRDASGASDVPVDLPCRFNPSDEAGGVDGGYRPNKTPDGYDTAAAGAGAAPAHPVFTQEGIGGRPASQSASYWSISDAIKYLLAEYNPSGAWTQYPALSTLDGLLASVYSAGDGPIDAGDIASDPLLIRDFDASNMPWPEAVAQLLGYAGFVLRWDLGTGLDGGPATYLRFYRTDMMATAPSKYVYLDEPGNSLADGSANNVVRAHLARDSNAIVNAWQVETAQRQVEVSVYLAPLYQVDAADAAAANRKNYTDEALAAADADGPTRRKYRWYGVDEVGDGYWDGVNKQWRTGLPFDFSGVFPPDDDGTPSYAARYRPAAARALALDTLGRPLRARLDVAFGVSATKPALAFDNPSIRWFNVPDGWRLLDDRLGIRLTGPDPQEWRAGGDAVPVIHGVTWWAAPPATINGVATNGYPPLLRLTCVVEDDLRMPISAGKRASSPTQFARWRSADARDHFRYASIDRSSANYAAQGGDGTDPLVMRDDTDAATSHAYALQRAHEMAPLAGSIAMQGVVPYYEVGDRISFIAGRDIPLYQSIGRATGELPTFPVVVAREIQLEPHVYTTIHLSDMRAAPRYLTGIHRDRGGNAW